MTADHDQPPPLGSMSTEAALMEFAKRAREALTKWATMNTDRPEIPTFLTAYRADGDGYAPVAEVAMASDRDEMLMVASKLRSGMAADVLMLSFDTFHATGDCNPDTGQPWAAGEMQEYVGRHGTGHAVHDALNVTIARPGEIWTIFLPYQRTRRKVRWLSPADMGSDTSSMMCTPLSDGLNPGDEDSDGKVRLGGLVTHQLRRIMDTAPIDIAAFPGELPPGIDGQALCDFHAMKLIDKQHHCVVASTYYSDPDNLARMQDAVEKSGQQFLLHQWRN